MRGRFLLFAALGLLTVLSPAQAGSPLGAVVKGDPLGGAVEDQVELGTVEDEVCVDVSTLFDDPTKVVVIAAQCTVMVTVGVEYNEQGHLVVTIVVLYAGFAYSCAIDSADPANLPSVGDHIEWHEPCWRDLQRSIV